MFDSVLSKKKEQLLSIRENLQSQATQIQKLGIQSTESSNSNTEIRYTIYIVKQLKYRN
jgi:hypothetical protein